MNVLGLFLQACISGLLTLVPTSILKKNQMKVTVALTFLTIGCVCYVGGLIFAVLVTMVLLFYFVWVRFLSRADNKSMRFLYQATVVLTATYLVFQIVHLQIRLLLGQPSIMIVANVAGILMALAMFSVFVDFAAAAKKGIDPFKRGS